MMLSLLLGGVFAIEEPNEDEFPSICGDNLENPNDWECFVSRTTVRRGMNWLEGTWGETDARNAGQDLYLKIYQKTKVNPVSLAVKKTAERYGIQAEQMNVIVQGNLGPILERNPSLRFEDAQRIYNQMMSTYRDIYNSESVKASTAAEIEPLEIFANGSTAEGGFDLVNDLNNIERILFNRFDEVTIAQEGSGGGLGGGRSNSADFNGVGGRIPLYVPNLNLGDLDRSGDTAGGEAGDDAEVEGNGGDSTDNSKIEECQQKMVMTRSAGPNNPTFLGSVNPNQCFVPGSGNQAYYEYLCTQGVDPDDYSDSEDGNGGEGDSETGEGDQNQCVPADEVCDGRDNNCNGQVDENPICQIRGGIDANSLLPTAQLSASEIKAIETPLAAADWKKPGICDDVACITVEFIKGTVKPNAAVNYKVTDNCIDCHVSYINAQMEETVKHHLVPSKLTGNLFETSQCKKANLLALGAIGMNVIVSTVPMPTPPRDNLINGGDIAKEWELYAAANGFWKYSDLLAQKAKNRKGSNPQPVLTPPLTDAERAILEGIQAVEVSSESPVPYSQEHLLNKAVEIQNSQNDQKQAAITDVVIAKEVAGPVGLADALDDEMKAMNAVFSNILQMLENLNEKNTGACTNLQQKQACQ